MATVNNTSSSVLCKNCSCLGRNPPGLLGFAISFVAVFPDVFILYALTLWELFQLAYIAGAFLVHTHSVCRT